MLRSEAARYARWSAAVALLLAAVTTAVYLERHWKTYLDQKKAPPAAPVDVERQSNGINFKKVELNQTVFEVQASKSTEFKGQAASLLEDVKITIFGKTGERHDVIHTQSCRYGKEDGGITCTGDVQIDLMSAADAQRVERDPAAVPSLTTRVETRGVTFNRASGVAQTDQQVTLAFPNGNGDAVGMEYESEQGAVRLRRNVRLTLLQPPGTPAKKTPGHAPEARVAEEVRVKGGRVGCGRGSRVMRRHGPAEAEAPTERLTAGQILLAL